MTKKKILQVCAIDASVYSLLKPLIIRSMDKGYEVHNACTNTGRFESLESQGLTMVDIPIDRRIHPVKNLKSIWKLYRLMKIEKYDIVHVHTPIAALLGRIAAKLAGIQNIIYTAHGFYFHEEMSKRKYRLFFNIEKYAAKWMTDWLLLQSKEDYELALKNNFKTPAKTIHLSNGVDIWNKFNPEKILLSEINELTRELNLTESDIVFSFIGRLVKEKGIFELIEAFKRVVEKYPQCKLIIIGVLPTSERDQESYKRLSEQLVHPNIQAIGYRKDIPQLMAISDTFILPSHREGLPRSIIEAMAMAKPIIATNIRGCREEVFPDENGILFEKGNIDSLEGAMSLLAANESLRLRYSLRSRELVEELFDEEKVLTKQIQLFNRITSS
ncbi:glycosyltransferase family 4 protein [Sporosarcina sp. Marseille-Q4943]|uniref:glycosyltransferase family 4 protein n=1 Tax=Sporosarcina sp. Marseille-Q4943 TaxID=2942204 RepID=UPI00208DBBFD|nr:glycosyltransferase family 4 protein [Sporosarcina sp. Marseille-Q4943]